MSSLEPILEKIASLPGDWHKAGSVSLEVLRAIVKHAESKEILHSLETGSGKTTLLFSHLSRNHKVFAVDAGTESVSRVRTSPILKRETVEYIEGPTQLTLPKYRFDQKFQIAMLDGPHGYPFPEMEYWCVYPHLEREGLLVVDDIQIPTIYNFFCFLKDDDMFELMDVVDYTAFFRRTDAPLFGLYGDGWSRQKYNKIRYPIAVVPQRELHYATSIARLEEQGALLDTLIQGQETLRQDQKTLRQGQETLRQGQETLNQSLLELTQRVTASPWQKFKYLFPISLKRRIKRLFGKL